MTSVSSSSSSSSVYAAYLAAKNANVPKKAGSNLVNNAAQLAENSGLFGALYGTSSDSASTSAVGVLNSLVNPYASIANPFSTGGGTAADEQASVDQAILGGNGASGAVAGTYNSSGNASSKPINAATDWSTLMQQNPALASAVSGEALNQSILSKLSAYA